MVFWFVLGFFLILGEITATPSWKINISSKQVHEKHLSPVNSLKKKLISSKKGKEFHKKKKKDL